MSSNTTMKVTVMPAGHGDCILVQCGQFNIMVDSGPHAVDIHDRVHESLINALGGQPIHLAIVTHYDDDHIGGLERMMEKAKQNESKIKINELLFNSPDRIRDYIEHHRDEEVNASARQALSVASWLSPCNAEAIVARREQYAFFDDLIQLTVLSPCGEDLLHYGQRMLDAIGTEELAGRRGRETPICGRIAELLAMHDEDKDADTSEANALSLAFILTFEKRSILFLGDSWPSRVTRSLAAMPHSETPVPLDLVFVSHHGSKKNNREELYRHFDATRYVISADGKQNPDVETFRRILCAIKPKIPEFFFSENSLELREMFSQTDICAHFPENGPMIFNL